MLRREPACCHAWRGLSFYSILITTTGHYCRRSTFKACIPGVDLGSSACVARYHSWPARDHGLDVARHLQLATTEVDSVPLPDCPGCAKYHLKWQQPNEVAEKCTAFSDTPDSSHILKLNTNPYVQDQWHLSVSVMLFMFKAFDHFRS